MPGQLSGRTIALAEGRQLEELAELLQQEGAIPLRCPMIGILDAPDPAPVLAWLRELVAGRFWWVILLTGEGLRRLLGFAERAGFRADVIEALARTRTLTRGPKPVRALKEIGLAPSRVAPSPTSEGVMEALRDEDLAGTVVGLQLYSDSPSPLPAFLTSKGAEVRTVLPYVYAPAADGQRVVELIDRMVAGGVDAIIFTSSPQVDRLFEVAAAEGRTEALRHGLARTRVAAVGPVVADNLRQRGVAVAVCPERGFVMKNLVEHLKRSWSGADLANQVGGSA
ncbi:MAG: uroporphyrinogen-III synthase [Gemmataceae bacterium]|nr:uroporphyrinogen-III synthase [Gemmataceae bacterium]MDW8263704.1 uroporphyrinogen-III synthase [Gemmataceae bacterium]